MDLKDIAGQKRPKIAYFSPFPPDRSGIAAFSCDLLPPLANFAEITLYTHKPNLLPDSLLQRFETHSLSEFDREHHHYDLALYQMGNSEYHEALYPLLLKYPGIVDLHDYYLHHFMAHRTMGKGAPNAYARELGYALGEEGYCLATAIRNGESPVPLYELPLNNRVLDSSLGLIVHSKYVAELVRQETFDRPIHIIPQIMESWEGQTRREALGLSRDDVLFASFGLISEAKQIDFFLHALKDLRQTHPQAHFLLVGETMPDADPADLIQELELDDAVHRLGYVAQLTDFMDWMCTADVVINLRNPTAGETSASALRAMAAGRPVVVFDHGWYGEIPDGAAVKVPVMAQEALLQAIIQLTDSKELRQSIGVMARQVIETENSPHHVAEAYLSAIWDTLNFIWQGYD